jgi:hypothetical protein
MKKNINHPYKIIYFFKIVYQNNWIGMEKVYKQETYKELKEVH